MDPILFISTVLAILGVIGSIVYAKRYISAQDVRGQLAAKDSVIATNQQTIASFESRIATLEEQLKQVTQELERARKTIEGLRAEIRELARYSAPEAYKRLEGKIDHSAQQIQEIHNKVI